MNYFELFELPEAFIIDQARLKKKYYELSRKYHPDFYLQAPDEERTVALENASEVNKGYKTLQHRDATIKYLLQIHGLLTDDEKYQLPPQFLMEVMEINEQLMEAKMVGEEEKISTLKNDILQLQQVIYEPVKNIIEQKEGGKIDKRELLPVKRYYFEKKYLDRILAAMP